MAKKATPKKEEVIIPFECGACRKTGINPKTHGICEVCNGTPERLA